ncbi:MAG: carbohydrate ABC transporter permease [Sphaerochaeta sp.]|jgi:sorbitol/mannitol transport system permease protein|nr:carbohydrate ABC transporter permease [Sphaerochaeta sp.]MDX9915101.1 carbohydrate ABC transporter permease [Sphaerochaeta sp.]
MENRTIEQVVRRARIRHFTKKLLLSLLIYGIAIFYFFPILYMFLSGFKTEQQAVLPKIFFTPTLETFKKVLSDPTMYQYLRNSLFQVIIGTTVSLVLGVPASFVLVFGTLKKPESNNKYFLWFITTILLPPVAVLIPLFTWYQKFNLINTPYGLLMAYVGFHTPIVVWMVHSFFSDLPAEIFDAAEIDGCTRLQQLTRIALPIVRTGIISAALLVAVFIWNEFFLGFNLTGNPTATLPVYMSRFREQQGMFVAQLSASSTIAVLPAIVLGWMTQKALVKGLTLGAVKG